MIPSRRYSSVLLREDSESPVAGSIFLCDLQCVISRAVIYYKYFNVFVGLSERGFYCSVNIWCCVVGWNDY